MKHDRIPQAIGHSGEAQEQSDGQLWQGIEDSKRHQCQPFFIVAQMYQGKAERRKIKLPGEGPVPEPELGGEAASEAEPVNHKQDREQEWTEQKSPVCTADSAQDKSAEKSQEKDHSAKSP